MGAAPKRPSVGCTMHVEIWSDVACPWCYVGKRRFEAALERFGGADAVEVTWRSFELDPEAPASVPGTAAEHLAAKYGRTLEEARGMNAQLTEVAAGEGLRYRLDDARLGSTFDAHRLLQLAGERGRQAELEERLFAARQCEAELVSDHEVLVRLATEVGLDADEVRAVLASDAYADAVREDERTGAALGISGVPTFVVEREIGVSGAQPAEVLLQLLEEGAERARANQPA